MPFIDDELLWCPDNDGKMVDLTQCLQVRIPLLLLFLFYFYHFFFFLFNNVFFELGKKKKDLRMNVII